MNIKRPKKYGENYTSSVLSTAVAKVRGKEMSIKKAAKHFGIPRSTIRSRLSQKNQDQIRAGPDTVLLPQEEKEIEEWIFDMQNRGYPITKDWLLDTVKDYLDSNYRKSCFVDNRPGRTWLQLFLKRHPKIALRTPEFVTSASAKVASSDIISWFHKIEAYLTKENLLDILQDPKRIINGDETSFQLNPKNKTVLALRGSQNVYDVERSSSKVNITTMFSFFASGETVPPTIIYPYKTIPKSVAEFVPPKWGIAKSENGWMTADIFRDYIRNDLNKHLERNEVEKPVIFITDGHSSHINIHTSIMCREMGIILIALYPNVTRIMQPADVAAFKPLKTGWTKAVQQFRRDKQHAAVNLQNFATVLQSCLRESLTVNSIKNGFKASGLFPWNYSAINFEKCLGESTASPKSTVEVPEVPDEMQGPNELEMELQTAKQTIKRCAQFIGSEKIKKFKSDFVCLENNEEQILQHIYTELQSSYPDIVESVTGTTDEAKVFCSFDYGSTAELSLVCSEVQNELEILTYKTNMVVVPGPNEVASSSSFDHGTSAEAGFEAELTENITPTTPIPGSSLKPLKDFLNVPPTPKRSTKREYKTKRYHVLTSDEFIEEFKYKEEEKNRLEDEKQKRKVAREERKMALEQERKEKAELKLLKANQKKQKDKNEKVHNGKQKGKRLVI